MNYVQLTQQKNNAELLHDRMSIEAALDSLALQLTQDYFQLNPVFLVVMNGGLVFAGQLLPRLNFPAQIDYCHATRYRGETTGGEIEWRASPQMNLENRHIVVLDDILDEGHTLQAIVENLKQKNVTSVKTAVLIEKQHDRKIVKNMTADYCELTTPDEYVFGFGMDVNHYWRNCGEIYILRNQ